MRQVIRLGWVLIFFATTVFFGLRIYLAMSAFNSPWALTYLFGLLLLLYLLFMLEGLQVSAIQIKTADAAGVNEFIENNVSSRSRPGVMRLATQYTTNFDDFVVGRQVFTIITVVSMAFLFKALPVDPADRLFVAIESFAPGWGASFYDFSTSFVMVFLISSLFPCWLSQLLPQFMADNRGIEFAQIPFSNLVTSLTLQIAKVGAGDPGRFLFENFRRASKRFVENEQIKPGEQALFERMVSYHGVYAERRVIKLKCSERAMEVSDTTYLRYVSGEHSSIRHSVRLQTAVDEDQEVRLGRWEFEFPPGINHDEPQTKTIVLKLDQIETSGMITENIAQELIFSMETSLEVPLPRTADGDEVTVTVNYEGPGATVDDYDADEINFDIAKPTRLLRIEVTADDGLFIRHPDVSFLAVDDLMILNDPQLLETNVDVVKNGQVWEIVAAYPPIGSRMYLSLDIRRTA